MVSTIRRWHGRIGVAASVLIAFACLTGLYLNHKKLFVRADHYSWPQAEKSAKHKKGGITTTSDLSSFKVSFNDALQMAQKEMGDDVELDEFEFKDDHGTVVYKLKAVDGREIIVNAGTGETKLKETYYEPSAAGFRSGGWDFNEIVGELHSGALLGGAGSYILDITAISLLILSVTGIWLFFTNPAR